MSNLDLSLIADNTTRLTLSVLTEGCVTRDFLNKLHVLPRLQSIKLNGNYRAQNKAEFDKLIGCLDGLNSQTIIELEGIRGLHGKSITGFPEGYSLNNVRKILMNGPMLRTVDFSSLDPQIHLMNHTQISKIKAKNLTLRNRSLSGATKAEFISLIENMNAGGTQELRIEGLVPSGVTVEPNNYRDASRGRDRFKVTSLSVGDVNWQQPESRE